VKVFLSWSGDLSRDMAIALHDWLPCVIQTLNPYVSAKDIHKGDRWLIEVSKELEKAAFGILCITPDNLDKPWLHFEAGALSKSVDTSRVIPLLLGVHVSDVEGPLAQFQAASVERNEMRDLLVSLNSAAESPLPDAVLESSFTKWWPDLEDKLAALEERAKSARQRQGMAVGPSLTNNQIGDILNRILEAVRSQQPLLRATAEAISPDHIGGIIRQALYLDDPRIVLRATRKRWVPPERPVQVAITLRQARVVAKALREITAIGSLQPLTTNLSQDYHSLTPDGRGLIPTLLHADSEGRLSISDAGAVFVSSVERLLEETDRGDDTVIYVEPMNGIAEIPRFFT